MLTTSSATVAVVDSAAPSAEPSATEPTKTGGTTAGTTANANDDRECQAAINMAVNVSLIPPKGMTLPLISSGGSSLLGSALTLGLALALTRRGPEATFSRLRPA